jgi:pyruvate/2-oxoglutarate dehydrogenase complex dihydrolipoamide acyltransferase (E2) component
MMQRIGSYQTLPYSKHRRNIELIVHEGWRKHATHALLELDVTQARHLLDQYKKKTKTSLSFTSWIVKCVAQAASEHPIINAYKYGKKKIIIFEDVDIPIPIEREINGEHIPMAYIVRQANKKSLKEISKEIRSALHETVDTKTQVLGKQLTRIERLALYSPTFIQKLIIWIVRRNGKFKKKYMGTIGVTAIGMKGRFPAWVVPLGGTISALIVVGGITKKPGVVENQIKIREYLHLTLTTDHDLIDGGPLVRFTEHLIELIESGYDIPNG